MCAPFRGSPEVGPIPVSAKFGCGFFSSKI